MPIVLAVAMAMSLTVALSLAGAVRRRHGLTIAVAARRKVGRNHRLRRRWLGRRWGLGIGWRRRKRMRFRWWQWRAGGHWGDRGSDRCGRCGRPWRFWRILAIAIAIALATPHHLSRGDRHTGRALANLGELFEHFLQSLDLALVRHLLLFGVLEQFENLLHVLQRTVESIHHLLHFEHCLFNRPRRGRPISQGFDRSGDHRRRNFHMAAFAAIERVHLVGNLGDFVTPLLLVTVVGARFTQVSRLARLIPAQIPRLVAAWVTWFIAPGITRHIAPQIAGFIAPRITRYIATQIARFVAPRITRHLPAWIAGFIPATSFAGFATAKVTRFVPTHFARRIFATDFPRFVTARNCRALRCRRGRTPFGELFAAAVGGGGIVVASGIRPTIAFAFAFAGVLDLTLFRELRIDFAIFSRRIRLGFGDSVLDGIHRATAARLGA